MDAGLVDLEAGSRTSSYHFSGSFPTLADKEGVNGDQRRLDYVFASKNLAAKVTEARIIASDTTLLLSDHLPVVIELKGHR
jgi:endonuclease/exonuclease/phosphatase family metal-dependent hydrolase